MERDPFYNRELALDAGRSSSTLTTALQPNLEGPMDSNPYQPPQSELPDPREKKFAKRLLSFRHNPITITSLFKLQAKRQVVVVIYFVLAFVLLWWVKVERMAYLVLGMFIGVLLCQLGLNWEKVERMAAGEQVEG
jgi:hypothetical protein